MNNLCNAATGHVRSSITARIIYIPVCSVLFLLYLRYRIAYKSSSSNEMSDRLRLISANRAFFDSVAIYVSSLTLIKPAQVFLNIV